MEGTSIFNSVRVSKFGNVELTSVPCTFSLDLISFDKSSAVSFSGSNLSR